MTAAAPKLTCTTVAASLAYLILPGSVQAAGFQLSEQNASGLGMAYSGQAAVAEDASTIYFNPAGLTRLPSRQVVLGGNLVRPVSQFSNSGSCEPYAGTGVGTTACPFGPGGNLGHTVGGDGGNSASFGFVPNLYASWETLPGRLWMGIGVNAPFGLKTDRDASWIGRFHGTLSETAAININPSVAWKITPTVSVGAGINAQYLTAKLANAVSYRAIALASGVPALVAATPTGSEGEAEASGHSWAWGWNLGIGIDLMPSLRLGLAYRSSIKHRLEGHASFGNRPAALGSVPQVADGDIAADVKLPDTASLALAWQATPALLLAADWTRTGWGSVQELRIERTSGPLAGQTLTSTALHFRNTWRAGLGAAYKVHPNWTLRAGIARDKGASPDEFRTPRLPEANRTWYALGAQWRATPRLAIDVGAAYIRGDNVSSSLVSQETATSLPRGSLVGSYDASAVVVGAQARVSF